jgi:hypothetical protein
MLESRKFLTSGDLISLKCSSASMRASLCFISQIHRKKLCFQIGGCIILDEPSLSNELSSFANGRIFGNVVIGIYSDHNSHEIDSHPRILVAAGKKAIAQKDSRPKPCVIPHDSSPEVDLSPNPYLQRTLICNLQGKEDFFNALRSYAKGFVYVAGGSSTFFKMCRQIMDTSQKLFILEKTGGAPSIVSKRFAF